MDEYKVKYNYSVSKIDEDKDTWLEGCEIIKARSYKEAQDKFKELKLGRIKDVELLFYN